MCEIVITKAYDYMKRNAKTLDRCTHTQRFIARLHTCCFCLARAMKLSGRSSTWRVGSGGGPPGACASGGGRREDREGAAFRTAAFLLGGGAASPKTSRAARCATRCGGGGDTRCVIAAGLAFDARGLAFAARGLAFEARVDFGLDVK